jgi:hypothetical protein
MGIKETQTHSSEPMQCSDLQLHTGLLIRRFGVRIPGGPRSNCHQRTRWSDDLSDPARIAGDDVNLAGNTTEPTIRVTTTRPFVNNASLGSTLRGNVPQKRRLDYERADSPQAEAIDPSVTSPLCAAKAARTSSFSRGGTPK